MQSKRKNNSLSPTSSPELTAHEEPALSEASDTCSLNSEEIDPLLPGGGYADSQGYADSDTGLESMSSAETQTQKCECGGAADILIEEVKSLKCDKLFVLRQNVVSIPLNIFNLLPKHQCDKKIRLTRIR